MSRNLLSRFQVILQLVQGTLWPKRTMTQNLQVPSADVSNFSKSHMFNVPVRGTRCSNREKSETLPEDIRVSEASDDAVYKKDFSWTIFCDKS